MSSFEEEVEPAPPGEEDLSDLAPIPTSDNNQGKAFIDVRTAHKMAVTEVGGGGTMSILFLNCAKSI